MISKEKIRAIQKLEGDIDSLLVGEPPMSLKEIDEIAYKYPKVAQRILQYTLKGRL